MSLSECVDQKRPRKSATAGNDVETTTELKTSTAAALKGDQCSSRVDDDQGRKVSEVLLVYDRNYFLSF